MPYTVLKVAKSEDDQNIEVAGEFVSLDDARRFAYQSRKHDPTHDYRYLIETPPSHIEGRSPPPPPAANSPPQNRPLGNN